MHVNPAIAALLEAMHHPSLPGIELSLERMRQLLAVLGHPERRMPPAIHVAGTNGKGSTIALMRAMYEAAGYRVHVYTSPHLVRFNERIVLAGREMSDDALLAVLQRVADAARIAPVTFFEATTAAAMLAFAENDADVLLLEVGLGGRLDATNLAGNIVASVITPIGRDHTEFLGDTLAAIAAEKAGILRVGVPAFAAEQVPEVLQVLQTAASALPCPLAIVPAGARQPALQGEHQRANAALAEAVVRALGARLPMPDDAIARGLTQAQWPARLQVLRYGPLVEAWAEHGDVVLDGGHNAHAAAAMAAWVRARGEPAMLICGLMQRKDATAFFAPLQEVLQRIACVPIPDAPDAYTPQALAAQVPGALVAADLLDAVAQLAPVGRTTLLVGGSLYLAGEVLKNHG